MGGRYLQQRGLSAHLRLQTLETVNSTNMETVIFDKGISPTIGTQMHVNFKQRLNQKLEFILQTMSSGLNRQRYHLRDCVQ